MTVPAGPPPQDQELRGLLSLHTAPAGSFLDSYCVPTLCWAQGKSPRQDECPVFTGANLCQSLAGGPHRQLPSWSWVPYVMTSRHISDSNYTTKRGFPAQREGLAADSARLLQVLESWAGARRRGGQPGGIALPSPRADRAPPPYSRSGSCDERGSRLNAFLRGVTPVFRSHRWRGRGQGREGALLRGRSGRSGSK